MEPGNRFAAEAAVFEQWARCGTAIGEAAAREAIERLGLLHLAGLALPPLSSKSLTATKEGNPPGDDECHAVMRNCARLPFDHYAEVFDPLVIPPQEPGLANISDDIIRSHWGRHATGAVRALHCWLMANAREPSGANS